MLLVLVLRFARAGREQERLRGEFEAARTVQQVLVPGVHVEKRKNRQCPGICIDF